MLTTFGSKEVSVWVNTIANSYYSTDISYDQNEKVGAVRWDPYQSAFLHYSGSYWNKIESNMTVTLLPSTVEVLEWATKKMNEEKMIKEYSEKYPAVRDIKERMDTLKDQMNVVLALVKDDTSVK